MPGILVVGSANRDLIVPVRVLPRPGETVPGNDPVERFGGKGANQAVAAARCGGRVTFLGAVGADKAGDDYLAHLAAEGIDTGGTVRIRDAATGSALILVEESAQNMIVVSPGANGHCTVDRLDTLPDALGNCAVVVLQLEIPLPTVRHVISEAAARGRRVILNPSPIQPGFSLDGLQVACLIVNTIELESLAGLPCAGEEEQARAAQALRRGGVENVIVTRGAESTLVVTSGGVSRVATHRVEPVDTVGAGDTFAGGFAALLAEGAALEDAVRFANVAAALSTLALGAQESMPTRPRVDAILA